MVHVLRVFLGSGGEHGNPLGVVLDGSEVPEDDRQGIAAELGFSETVFVDDAERGELRIFTPAVELPFAGHPLVGTGWLLGEEGAMPPVLRPPAGEVPVRRDGELVWISGRGEWAPPAQQVKMDSPSAVDDLEASPIDDDAYCWAWADEGRGAVRTRGFFPREGIVEDEATGSAALALCVALGRDIEVRQGEGSLIQARHLGNGRAEVAGAVALDHVRPLPG